MSRPRPDRPLFAPKQKWFVQRQVFAEVCGRFLNFADVGVRVRSLVESPNSRFTTTPPSRAR